MNQSVNKLKLLRIIVFALLVISVVISTRQTQAQSGDPFQVYLPLISQESSQSQGDCPSGDMQWLCLLNQYRVATGLNTVASDPDYSSDLALHTNYLLLNPSQEDFHVEDPSKPGYTEDGKNAGLASNLARKASTDFQVQETMELWMKTPGHHYHMLHPNLSISGFDLSCDNVNCYSGLNIFRGLSSTPDELNVIYPGENQTDIPAEIFPVTWGFYIMPWMGDCIGADLISGEIFNQQNQKISISRVSPDHCDYRNQVVLMPVEPFLSNHTYRVEMTVQYREQTLRRSWTFTTR